MARKKHVTIVHTSKGNTRKHSLDTPDALDGLENPDQNSNDGSPKGSGGMAKEYSEWLQDSHDYTSKDNTLENPLDTPEPIEAAKVTEIQMDKLGDGYTCSKK